MKEEGALSYLSLIYTQEELSLLVTRKRKSITWKLFKVKGEFREEHIGFSGEAPFFLHSQSSGREIS